MDLQNQLDMSAMYTTPGIQSSQEQYIPSSVEKKRALMMYFLFGIMIVIANKKVNDFEFFHVKQAMGWRMIFILSILLSSVILFVPMIKILGVIVILSLMVVFFILAKQAWDGKYYGAAQKYPLAIFPSLGTWLLSLFDITFENMSSNQIDKEGGAGSIQPPVNS